MFRFITPILVAVGLSLTPELVSAQQFQRGGAPPTTRILGVVEDGETGEGLMSASVAVWSMRDSTLATGTIADENGAFSIEGVRPGRYYVHVSFIGYLTETIEDVALVPGSWIADLGTIVLRPDAQIMDEVVVEERRTFMEVGIDRTVYNTRDQLVSAGGNASDVLEEIPSVEVDIDGNISLRGNQNVAILINGRPTSMSGEALISFLQGLPSHAVDRVEVIPNPSAKYEPDGMSGILNIVLRKDQDRGLGGSVTLGGGTQSTYQGSGSLNYQRGRFSSFLNYGYRHNRRDIVGDRFQENRVADPWELLDREDSGHRGGSSHNLSASVDYGLGDKSTLSLATVFSIRDGDRDGFDVYHRTLDLDRAEIDRYDRTRTGSRSDINQDYRLTFSRIVDPGTHELKAEFRFERENERSEASYLWTGRQLAGVDQGRRSESSDEEENTGEGSFQLDYSRPLLAGKIETGYKGSINLLDSQFDAETYRNVLDGDLRQARFLNTFDYRRDIHAAYGIMQQQFGKVATQVGVRLEQAVTTFDLTTTDERYENDYFSIFPSAFLTYELQRSETGWKQFKLSYSKRINRPNTWRLNPLQNSLDPFSRREGNPYLEPEYTHAMEASYVHFSGPASLTLTPYYRKTVNKIQWYELLNDQGVSIVTFRNFDSSDSWGAEAIGTLRLSNRLNAFASFNAFRYQTDGSNVESDLGNDSWGWTMRGNATMSVREGLDVQLSYFYRAPMSIENGRIGSFSRMNVGLRQQLLNERASLSLRISDPFDMMAFNITRDTERFYQESFRKFNARQLSLSLTWNLGQQRPQRRDRGDERGGPNSEDMQEVQM